MENKKRKYKAKVYLCNGGTTTRTFTRKCDAEAWKAEKRKEQRHLKEYGLSSPRDIKFKELVQEWLSARVDFSNAWRTRENYRSDVNTHLIPEVGEIHVRQIQTAHADSIRQTMKEKGLANRTINKVLIRFKQVLNFGVERRYILVNPLARYRELPEPPKKDEFLTVKEIEQLLRANFDQDIYPVLIVALNTGLRLGEVAGLCWDRVDFNSKQIEVTRTLARKGLQETTKTHLKRVVPMNSVVADVLRKQLRNQTDPRFIFTNRKGEAYFVDHLSQRHFKRALRRAGLPSFRFHSLRHTYASHFMMNGGNIYDLQKILGHTKIEMTARYAHLSPEHLMRATEIVCFNFETERGANLESYSSKLAPRNLSDQKSNLISMG